MLGEHGDIATLKRRLRDPEGFREALSVLMVASKVCRSGFNVHIDVRAEREGRVKLPDLKLQDPETNDELYVEVTIVGDSQTAREATSTFQAFNAWFRRTA